MQFSVVQCSSSRKNEIFFNHSGEKQVILVSAGTPLKLIGPEMFTIENPFGCINVGLNQ